MRSRERDTLNNSFEISLAMPVFSLTKHDPQKSAVSTCLKSSDLPFNLPPPLTFLQSLRNRCLWFGMPHSAVSLLCMIFMPIKIQVLMMDFFFSVDFTMVIHLQLDTALCISRLVLCYGSCAELPELHL